MTNGARNNTLFMITAGCGLVVIALLGISRQNVKFIEETPQKERKEVTINSNDTLPVYPPANHDRVCSQNPFLPSLDVDHSVIKKRMAHWLANVDSVFARITPGMGQRKDHAMFFPFDPFIPCPEGQKACVGGDCSLDNTKIVCGVEKLSTPSTQKDMPCVVYSIGSNNEWDFELDLLKRTQCEIHSFDCTGPIGRFQKPEDPRIHFHHVCLATEYHPGTQCTTKTNIEVRCGESWTLLEMQRRLQHKRIDLFKIDAEGWEWMLFESWPELSNSYHSQNILLPMQICVEVHKNGIYSGSKEVASFVVLLSHLIRIGYTVVYRNDNQRCPTCSELTLMRVECPNTGVYAPEQ